MIFRHIFICLFLAGTSHAQIVFPAGNQKDRIMNKARNVQQSVDAVARDVSAQEQINLYSGSLVRGQLSDLQNLIRIYAEMNCCKNLTSFYDESKQFEDLISHMGDLNSFVRTAASDAKAHYQGLLAIETAKYADFIMNSRFFKKGNESFLGQLSSVLDSTNWPSLEQDRNDSLTVLAHRLTKIHKKVYDFSQVENGIHEFKRDVRRFSYLRSGYSGLVTDDANQICPTNVRATALEPTAVAAVPATGAPRVVQYACQVSSCLTSKLDTATVNLNSIKLQALQYELQNQKVPAELVARAQAIHDDIIHSNVLLLLSAQLKACRSEGTSP